MSVPSYFSISIDWLIPNMQPDIRMRFGTQFPNIITAGNKRHNCRESLEGGKYSKFENLFNQFPLHSKNRHSKTNRRWGGISLICRLALFEYLMKIKCRLLACPSDLRNFFVFKSSKRFWNELDKIVSGFGMEFVSRTEMNRRRKE